MRRANYKGIQPIPTPKGTAQSEKMLLEVEGDGKYTRERRTDMKEGDDSPTPRSTLKYNFKAILRQIAT